MIRSYVKKKYICIALSIAGDGMTVFAVIAVPLLESTCHKNYGDSALFFLYGKAVVLWYYILRTDRVTSPFHWTALILMRNRNTQSCCKTTMMGEAANEAIMVSGKSHLSQQAPAEQSRLRSRHGETGDRAHIDCRGSRDRAGKMKDARTHQPN